MFSPFSGDLERNIDLQPVVLSFGSSRSTLPTGGLSTVGTPAPAAENPSQIDLTAEQIAQIKIAKAARSAGTFFPGVAIPRLRSGSAFKSSAVTVVLLALL